MYFFRYSLVDEATNCCCDSDAQTEPPELAQAEQK